MRNLLLLITCVPAVVAWSPLYRHLRPESFLRAARQAEHDGVISSSSESSSNRRKFVSFGAMAALPITSHPAIAMNNKSRSKGYAVQKTDAEWRAILSPTQYDILRLGGTERPYSSILEGEKRAGTFVCAGCGTPLFASDQKFKSGTGWPSFARGLDGVEVEDVSQVTANLVGAELRCGTCGGHLGDVFADGFLFPGTPAFTSGKRYCIDGAALVFEPANGDSSVRGDLSPPKQEPDWLSPPKISARQAV
jgi:peptide-methionine (R)-S-oxide reductase